MVEDTSNRSALQELKSTVNRNVFVMMRYRADDLFQQIETTIAEALAEYDLIARFAKDSAIVDDLWENIIIYMENCRYGVVVFEDINERDFNPNISLELGYMYAKKKRCLLLKEQRMPRLPTDICGRIYRNFDAHDVARTIRNQLLQWCDNDLGRTRKLVRGKPSPAQYLTKYDSRLSDPGFRTWNLFFANCQFHTTNSLVTVKEDSAEKIPLLALQARDTELVGVDRAFNVVQGRARFQYRATASEAANPNLLLCVIPMKGAATELVEVGAQQRDEPENAYSPYRVRHFVPEAEIGDQTWHWAELEFDFSTLPSTSYSILACRINEGCPRPGPGELQIKTIQLLAPSDQ